MKNTSQPYFSLYLICTYVLINCPKFYTVGCIWQFNGCVEHQMPEELCRERWTECKMIIMGMGAANQDAGYPDRPTGSVVSTTVVEESEESPFRSKLFFKSPPTS